MKTGKSSYPDVVRALLGRPGGLALEISIVLRCFGALFWLTQSTKALWLHSGHIHLWKVRRAVACL